MPLAKSKHMLRGRYQQLSVRDRRAVLMLAVLLLALLAYSLAINPAHQYYQAAGSRVQAETELLHWIESQRGPALQRQNQPRTEIIADSLMQHAVSSAQQHELHIRRVEPGLGGLSLWLEAAVFDQVLTWLHGLEQQGVELEQVIVSPTRQAGLVDVHVIVRNNAA